MLANVFTLVLGLEFMQFWPSTDQQTFNFFNLVPDSDNFNSSIYVSFLVWSLIFDFFNQILKWPSNFNIYTIKLLIWSNQLLKIIFWPLNFNFFKLICTSIHILRSSLTLSLSLLFYMLRMYLLLQNKWYWLYTSFTYNNFFTYKKKIFSVYYFSFYNQQMRENENAKN
jgi:hypothetical protein